MKSLDTGDRSPESPNPSRFCTRVATGRCPVFQEIYVCQTCRSDSSSKEANDFPLCICSACADCCHENHEVEYVGMGPCFCDCSDGSCRIADESIVEATRIGINTTNDSNPPCQSLPLVSKPKNDDNEELASLSYIRDVYRIPLLQNNVAFRRRLVQQATELIRHSRDTFWLDAGERTEDARAQGENMCDLERFVWQVIVRHLENYWSVGEQRKNTPVIKGAEWWVQVKPVSSSSLGSHAEKGSESSASDHFQEEAIDLHYDKDEEVAASFGLGVFPSLSTVTYLTDSTENAAPTLIFSRRYDSDEEELMTEMFVSRPSFGKHVVFDGRLLHGAPSHPLLRKHNVKGEVVEASEPAIRITFLVNIWLNYKPARVNSLPQSIRECIEKASDNTKSSFNLSRLADAPLEFVPVESVPTIVLSSLVDQPEICREPIELPFVGGKSTWADEDDDLAMVVKVYPPPPAQDHFDTVLIQFGPGLEATFDYCGSDVATEA